MIDDLVRRLHQHHEAMLGPDYYQAASALEAKDAEIARLRSDLRTVQNAAKSIANAHNTELEHLRQNAAFDHKLRTEYESLQARDSEMTDMLLAAESRITDLERQLAAETERCARCAESKCHEVGTFASITIATAIRGGAK